MINDEKGKIKQVSAGKKILLVEDDALIAMFETRILTDHGYNVIIVSTGESAIETVNACNDIDLILMDINLGKGIDGTQAAEIILQTHDIPLVFLSSHTEPEIVEKTEGITSYGYIVKDSGETVLLASLKMAFKLFDAKIKEQEKEAELEKSEARYYTLFDNISSGVAIYEACDNGNDFMIRDFNKTAEIMTNITKDEVLNQRVTITFPGIREFGLFDVLKRVLKSGVSERLPMTYYQDNHLSKYYDNYVYKLPSNEIVAVFNDYTEKKQIEEALQESENHFKTMADSGQGLIWTSGTDMMCTYFNKVWLDFRGRTMEEELGDGWTEGLHPEDKEYCISTYIDAFNKRESFGMEYRILNYKGEYCWIYDKGSPRYNSKGDFIGYIGHCLDIDDRKKIEEDLIQARKKAEESEIRFKALHNASFGGIIIHDKGKILECNQGLSDMTGYSYDELIGMDGLLLIEESYRSTVMNKIQTANEKPYEIIAVRKNGELYPARLEAREIPYKGKNVRTVEFRDITEQKKAQRDLIESENRYRLLFENMTTAFALHNMIYDEEGNPADYVFTEINPAFERLTGVTASNLIGHRVKDALPETEQYWIDIYGQVAKTGKSITFENYSKAIDKTFEVSAFSPSKDSFAVIFNDITERKLTQNTLSFIINCGLPGQEEDYFLSISRYLAETLKINCVIIGRLVNDMVQTLAVYHSGHFDPNFMYSTADSPCGNTISKHFCVYKEGICLEYPQNKLLAAMNAESYVGTVLPDSKGNPMGLIALIDTNPLTNVGRVEMLLKQVVPKTTGELERRAGVEKINQLLKEKDIILKEVHHRIKNNMNTIYSLLMIQAQDQKNESVKMILKESANRLQSMKILYEKLFRFESYSELSLKLFLPQLLNDIIKTFHTDEPVMMELEIEDIILPPEYLAPLGIITNELISNSFKYGFPHSKEKRISLFARKNHKLITLVYLDNGTGLPEDFQIEHSPGFGMQLIRMLVQQIKGEFSFRTGRNAEFCIQFYV